MIIYPYPVSLILEENLASAITACEPLGPTENLPLGSWYFKDIFETGSLPAEMCQTTSKHSREECTRIAIVSRDALVLMFGNNALCLSHDSVKNHVIKMSFYGHLLQILSECAWVGGCVCEGGVNKPPQIV